MSEEHLARPFQRCIVCWYRITLSLLGGDLRFYQSSLYGLLAPGNESAEERKGQTPNIQGNVFLSICIT